MSRRLQRPSAIDLWPDSGPLFGGPQNETRVDEHAQSNELEEDTAPLPELAAGLFLAEEDGIEPAPNTKNLNPTCVTPLIACLAQDLFSHLVVSGPPLQNSYDGIIERKIVRSEKYTKMGQELLDTLHSPPPHFSFPDEYLIPERQERCPWKYYSGVVINAKNFQVGDVVIVPAGENGKQPAPIFPKDFDTKSGLTIPDLFWFAKLISIREDEDSVHVQWFQHGCKTILGELAHPLELYLTKLCDKIPIVSILGRCSCFKLPAGKRPDMLTHDTYFYSFQYDQLTAVFSDLYEVDKPFVSKEHNLCAICSANHVEHGLANFQRVLHKGRFAGISSKGDDYHHFDFVIVRLVADRPCDIAQILKIEENLHTRGVESYDLTVKILGRMTDVIGKDSNLTAGIYEERHYFMTDEVVKLTSAEIVRKCIVIHKGQLHSKEFKTWITSSPNHFYITMYCASREIASKASLSKLDLARFTFCGKCTNASGEQSRRFGKFSKEVPPLRLFDPFAGVGAFALAMCQAGSMELTHAIELSTSAAETLRKNSPKTIIYNQCSNKVLEHAATQQFGQDAYLKDLGTEKDITPPPKRGDIDCIVSGFPCQPHSSLNMFQKARDLENELFLNTISWVDHLRPKYVVFENVEGFLDYKLRAVQKSTYAVHGGIEKGGIKFLVRSLVTLGYQVRFGLLQAAHYGTPQTRVRFFLWAAQSGRTLPDLPQPTHDFPRGKKMTIKFPNGDAISPIDTRWPVAPAPFASVGDAISDLKRWDWANPHKVYPKKRGEHTVDDRNVLQIKCRRKDPHCGLEGKGIEYEHPPHSALQARCRLGEVKDIQHITPCFLDEVIERVINIELRPGADYRDLYDMPKLWEHQVWDPSSANAKKGYKGGMYGRLDPNGAFNTIVTNVSPTVKQSKVLNPWCKRIVTVRELARSQGFPDDFQFFALDGRVTTLHKQIGNAVPWELSAALGRELLKSRYMEWIKASDRMEVDN